MKKILENNTTTKPKKPELPCYIDTLSKKNKEKITLYIMYNTLTCVNASRMLLLLIMVGVFAEIAIGFPLLLIDFAFGFLAMIIFFLVFYGYTCYWYVQDRKQTTLRRTALFGNANFDQFLEELEN